MGSQQWDEIVLLGDVSDLDCISSHNARNLRAIAGKTVLGEFDRVRTVFEGWWRITKWRKAPRGVRVAWVEGNHEYRLERWIDENPQMAGLAEIPKVFEGEMKVGRLLWVPYWSKGQIYKIGKAKFGHGRWVNEHHAKKHAQRYGCNFYYGHTHDIQTYSMELDGDDSTYEASSLGCLCRYDQSYLNGRPTKWQQAFGVFHFMEDGLFNQFTVRIFGHRFVSPEGRVFGGG